MVGASPRNEFVRYGTDARYMLADAGRRIPALSYLPVMLTIEGVGLRRGNLYSESHLFQEGNFKGEREHWSKMRKTEYDGVLRHTTHFR